MPPRTDSFEGLHVLLVTEDDARAQAIAKALRERKAHVGDVRAGSRDPVALRGADLLVIDARRAAATETRISEVRSDVRARWASVATIDYTTLASGEGTVDLRALEGIVSRLAGMDKALTDRARKETSFETSLAPLGPTRTLRALALAGPTLHVELSDGTLKATVDLADELLVSAFAERSEGKSEAWLALARVLGMTDATIKVERRAHPTAMNIMEPVDQALEVAAQERARQPEVFAREEQAMEELSGLRREPKPPARASVKGSEPVPPSAPAESTATPVAGAPLHLDEPLLSERPAAAASEQPRAAASERPAAVVSERPAAALSDRPAISMSERPAAASERPALSMSEPPKRASELPAVASKSAGSRAAQSSAPEISASQPASAKSDAAGEAVTGTARALPPRARTLVGVGAVVVPGANASRPGTPSARPSTPSPSPSPSKRPSAPRPGAPIMRDQFADVPTDPAAPGLLQRMARTPANDAAIPEIKAVTSPAPADAGKSALSEAMAKADALTKAARDKLEDFEFEGEGHEYDAGEVTVIADANQLDILRETLERIDEPGQQKPLTSTMPAPPHPDEPVVDLLHPGAIAAPRAPSGEMLAATPRRTLSTPSPAEQAAAASAFGSTPPGLKLEGGSSLIPGSKRATPRVSSTWLAVAIAIALAIIALAVYFSNSPSKGPATTPTATPLR